MPGEQSTKSRAPEILPQQVQRRELAGEAITAMLTDAPGNHASIEDSRSPPPTDGSRLAQAAPRMCINSCRELWGAGPLRRIQDDAQALIKQVFTAAGRSGRLRRLPD